VEEEAEVANIQAKTVILDLKMCLKNFLGSSAKLNYIKFCLNAKKVNQICYYLQILLFLH